MVVHSSVCLSHWLADWLEASYSVFAGWLAARLVVDLYVSVGS